MKAILSLAGAVLFSVALSVSVWADEVKGTVSKVENGGRVVVIKTKAGKEVSMKISGSRTKLEGIGDRSEFKAGQKVTAEVDGDSAKNVKVAK